MSKKKSLKAIFISSSLSDVEMTSSEPGPDPGSGLEKPCDRPRTLLVRHLPAHLSINEREDLLRFFGAKSVRCMSDSGRMKFSGFATFDTPDQAANAVQELHQLDVLGSRLKVEFSNREFLHNAPWKLPKPAQDPEKKKKEQLDLEELEPIVPDDIDHLAPSHKIEYPINPKLMYSYPPPTMEILTNIMNALASVPKFYVQVLHLMNKMNLPAPFGPPTQAPPIPSGVSQEPIQELDMEVTSSEESELESDGEEDKKEPGVKRPGSMKKTIVKRPKLQKIISAPKTGKALKRHEVFERPPKTSQTSKTKEVGNSNPNLMDSSVQNTDVRKFITLHELEKHRLSSRRMRKMPLFKNYESGCRNSILLIENLHKDVHESMITYVFGRYINWENESEKNSYCVNLDREKKCCSVSFPSEDVAELACQETNGYKLMGEYMVVKFQQKSLVKVEDVEKLDVASSVTVNVVPKETVVDVEERASAVEAAFTATEETSLPDVFRASTPEMTDGATPERLEEVHTPEKGQDQDPETIPRIDTGEIVDSVSQTAESSVENKTKMETESVKNPETEELMDYEDSRFISKSELDSGRITEDKMSAFKVFNNYKPGETSDRLYIKNLNPKAIQEDELVWIFGGFLRDREKDAAEQLVIKIMKEGRMKGQAFVTFPSSAEAELALKSTNGFVIHGKPMVVVFGKKS